MIRIDPHNKVFPWLIISAVLLTLAEGAAKPKRCESPWRTFRSVCFMFADNNHQKFEDAQTICYKKGGFLASIRNSQEQGFLIKTIQGMGSSLARVRWLIGLYQYDETDNRAYRWLDGSVSSFRNWMPTQPNSVYERCTLLDGSNGYKWRDEICSNRALFICRKDLEKDGSMSCFKGHPPPQQILEKKGVSVTECLEHCRGLGFPLAGSVPDKCFCLNPDNMNVLKEAERHECNGNCQNQHCGNNNFITIYNLTYYTDTAESCEDLSQLGLSNPSTYVTKSGEEEKLQNCFSDECAKKKDKCDKPWRTFRNVCFMFSDVNNQKFDDAQQVCYKLGGFLASVRSSAEHGFIIKTIQGMGSSYQRVRWFIGLYQYDPNDNLKYRWLDGSVSNFRNWMPTQPNSIHERCAMLDGSNGFKWRDDVCTNRALFICRKDLDEENGSMNCFKGKPPPTQILEKKDISVTECLEHCRGLGFPLAGVIPNKCFCLNKDNVNKKALVERLQCSGKCGNQHCGNKDFVTIYNLTQYKDTADSCEDLSMLGFSSPSTYVTKVGDEERLTNCFTGEGDKNVDKFKQSNMRI